MAIEIKVPVLPESVTDATIATWHKKPGEPVSRDENLVDVETDKVVLEVVAPEDGTLESIIKNEGENVSAQEVIAKFKAGSVSSESTDKKEQNVKEQKTQESKDIKTPNLQVVENSSSTQQQGDDIGNRNDSLSPAVRKLLLEKNLDASNIQGTGKSGRITTKDVNDYLENNQGNKSNQVEQSLKNVPNLDIPLGARAEKRVPMTRLRARIAQRLLQAQHENAILTTFNEVNMKPVMDLRKKYKDQFEKVHGVKLGFMSFFTAAALEALKRFPAVNASIDGQDIVYHGFYDIGIAVSSPRGLVVPVLRNVDQMSLADIETEIKDMAIKAADGKLSIEEMTGGTFTISNGGTFGSLMSTPILNPPQSAILGMHKIEERAVVEDGQIVIRPMMYLALSYDHRIIDGSESVRFLVTIKEALEDPARLLLGI